MFHTIITISLIFCWLFSNNSSSIRRFEHLYVFYMEAREGISIPSDQTRKKVTQGQFSQITGGKFGQHMEQASGSYDVTREEPKVGHEISHATINTLNITTVVVSPTENPLDTFAQKKSENQDDDEWTELSHNFRYNHRRCVAGRQYIFYGQEYNSVTGARHAVIKLLPYTENNTRHARILKELNDPHIVTTYHVDSCTLGHLKHMYLALELCDEMNLHQHILTNKAEEKRFNSKVSISQSKQLVDALCYVHSKKILHRNLKPHNILLSTCKRILKITDFGMAIKTDEHTDYRGLCTTQVGTDGYRASEVCYNVECSESSDVFSLGLILFFLWSYGLHPFGDDPDEWNINIKKRRTPDWQGLLIEDDRKAIDLLHSMLQHTPNQRPSADQLGCFEIFSARSECGLQKKSVCDKTKPGNIQAKRETRGEQKEHETAKSIETTVPKSHMPQTPVETSDSQSEKRKDSTLSVGTKSSPGEKEERGAWHHSSFKTTLRTRSRTHLERPRSDTDLPYISGPRQKPMNQQYQHGKESFNSLVIFDKLLCGTRIYNPAWNTWKPMHMIHPKMASQNFSAVSMDKYIYLLFNEKKFLRLQAQKFNAMWEELPSMKYQHGEHPPAVVHGGKIYVIGSSGGDNCDVTHSIECFDPAQNCWSVDDEAMTDSRCHHAVAAVEDRICCIGGQHNNSVLKSAKWYDPNHKTWSSLPPMSNNRAIPSAIFHLQKLFVLGGYSSTHFMRQTKLASVEMFDIKSSTWSIFMSMQKPRAAFSAVVINKQLFAVGGDCKRMAMGNDVGPEEKNTIERYCFNSRTWSVIHVKKEIKIDSMSATAIYYL